MALNPVAGAASAPGPVPSDLITKSEFARRRNVSPARVTQWIEEGKIHGDALIGEGRAAKIVEAIAIAQLNEKLDVGQRFGNGLATRLDLPAPVAAPVAAAAAVAAPPVAQRDDQPVIDSVEKQIARERLEALQRQNRAGAIEEAERAGRLTDSEAVARSTGKMAVQLISVFEGALPELATAIAAKHHLPQRDVLHLLRAEFRKVRETAALAFKRQAGEMPELAPFDVEDETADA